MIAIVGLSACPLSARAGQVIVSNLNQPPDPSTSQVDPTDFFAQEFTTGGSFTLQNIVASLGNLIPGQNAGDLMVTAQLISVTSETTTPDLGTVVATFANNTASIPTSGFSPVVFDPTSTTVSLNASSFYWFVLSATGDTTGSVQWQFADTFNSTGPGSLPNIAFFTSGQWTVLNETPFLIQVNAVGGAVPEPSSLVMGCMGFAAALFARRRLKSRGAA